MDYELRGNEPVTQGITGQLDNSAILLLILSPGYLASEWCCRELSLFVDQVGKGSGRIFIVERESVERPEALRDLLGYKFWVKDEANYPRTLGVPKPEEVTYFQRLNELAHHLVEQLKLLRAHSDTAATLSSVAHAGPQNSMPRATIFLAEVTDDLQEIRAEVETYLQQQNIRVLPSTLYYFPNAEEIRQAIDADLQESTLFVQLLSSATPRRPPGMSTPQMQYEAAKAIADLPIVQWRDRRVDLTTIQEPPQRAFLDAATVVATGIEAFKQYIIQQLEALEARRLEAEKRKQEEHIKQTLRAASLQDKLVFINTGPEDLSLAHEIADMLKEEGFGFSLPLLADISPSEKRRDLEENLRDCDAVVVLYANTSVVWVREQLRYCRRMQGQRERPLKIIAVFNQASADKPPLGMNLRNMQVLEFSTLRDSTCFPIFIQALQHE
jgi:hypothetical protein